MRVLSLSAIFPLPLDMGGSVRALGLLEALAASSDLTLLARARPDTTPDLVAELEEHLQATVEVFPRAPDPRGGVVPSTSRWLSAGAQRTPPWVLSSRSPELEARAKVLAPSHDVAVAHDDLANVYSRALHGLVPVVVDKQNVRAASLRERPEADIGLRAAVRHDLGRRLETSFEGRYDRYASALVVTSEEEADRFAAAYGRRPEAVVPSAVSLPTPRRLQAGARGVAWLGDLTYYANEEGLLRFAREAWEPLGRQGLELLVIGREPSPAVRDLEHLPGVRVLGYVDDLLAVLGQAVAAVVPLWTGAGVKLKTLTLMGSEVPVVATPVALEGVRAQTERDALVADDPAGLARGIERLTRDSELAQRIGSAGRQLVVDQYTWDRLGQDFVQVVRQAASGSV